MKDLYMTYGAAGSNEIGVLFVEGDGGTDVNALNGIGNTQGDWVTGTPYPILDDANIANYTKLVTILQFMVFAQIEQYMK